MNRAKVKKTSVLGQKTLFYEIKKGHFCVGDTSLRINEMWLYILK